MRHLVIIIPAFNEEKGIGSILDGMPKAIESISEIDVIVINDGSTDNTEKIAREKGAEVITHPYNMGLGISFRRGLERALEKGADIIANIDADGQFDPQDIPGLVFPIIKGEAEVVTASRFKSADHSPEMSKTKVLGNKLMSLIISKIVRKKFHDVSCGFRAYSRDAALRMNLFGKFTYTQETFIDLASKNISIIEIPVKVRGEREFGESKIASNLFKYGFNTLRIILSAFRDYKPLRLMFFVSLFFILIGTLSGSFFLVHYIRTGAFKPHTWAGFLSFSSFILAIFMLIAGIFMEMFSRMRMNQEQLLYLARKEHYEKLKAK
ncbi:MAG: glycosyltransferase family 2 protein [Candidatus Aminicenantes bacterium]|nr:MAG: glycosyltransferase family 2 protein [Candidatus Aminicenantes bacterium]